jgi:GIY-YIG catalytic domain
VRHEIADRISAALLESESPLASDAIAETYLKLAKSSGPAVDMLVRAILGKDGRFCEITPGNWILANSTSQRSSTVMLAVFDIPATAGGMPWLWQLRARLADDQQAPLVVSGHQWNEDLAQVFEWLRQYPVATDRPGYLSRWLGAQERIHALPENEPLIVDLAAWRKRLQPTASAPLDTGRSVHQRAPARSKPTGECDPLVLAADTLAEIVDVATAQRLGSWDAIALATAEPDPEGDGTLWREEWTFTPEDIQNLPEQPGIYRFLGAKGEFLYIGKSLNLRQRVTSYFRPLADNSSRRAKFLSAIRSFEFEPVPTELEALILESREIRTKKPAWNVMINLGLEEAGFPLGEEEILFLVPHGDGGGRSLFALSGVRAAIGALNPDGDAETLIAGLRRFYVEGSDGDGLSEISGLERSLVRRWLRTAKESCVLFYPLNFPTYEELAGAVFNALIPSTADENIPPDATLGEIIRG